MDPRNPDGKAGFTLKCAQNFFLTFVDREIFNVGEEDVNRCFVHSLMTITNEEGTVSGVSILRKYYNLLEVEWIECLCRLALIGFKNDELMAEEPIAVKVQCLLKGIWDYFFEIGAW
jgi:hypothetical protein